MSAHGSRPGLPPGAQTGAGDTQAVAQAHTRGGTQPGAHARATSAAHFEAARAAFVAGVQAFETGELARAEALFLEALGLVPGRPSALINLAAVRQQLGRPAEALQVLEQALAAQPDDVPAWFQRGQLLQMLGRPADALQSYERVLALERTHAAAWTQRGSLLKDMGRLAEAASCFREALERGGDAELNRYFLASAQAQREPDAVADDSTAAEPPANAPRHYVQALFDSYAEGFDEHLLGKLGYRVPALITEMLLGAAAKESPRGAGAASARRWRAALDLGCGTGLVGRQLAPHCEAVDGVDLSPLMLRKAHSLGVYRHLVHGDLAEYLQATRERHDLVVAADVFIYVGALEAVFAGVARVLEPGGLFAFSVEQAGAGVVRYALRASSRYAHAEVYLRTLAAAHGLEVRAAQRTVVRHEQRAPIDGLLLLAARR